MSGPAPIVAGPEWGDQRDQNSGSVSYSLGAPLMIG